MVNILVSTHNYCIVNPQGNIRKTIINFLLRFLHRSVMVNQQGKIISDNSKIFATKTKDGKEIRLHINTLEEFKSYLLDCGVSLNEFNFINVPLKEPVLIELNPNKEIVPRDYQIPVIDFIKNKESTNCKLVPLGTGQGKTICALLGITHLQYRTALIMKPSYIHRWVPDVVNVLGIDPTDVITVNGSAQLKMLISRTMSDDLFFKVVLISNKTFQSYISEYELYGEDLLNLGYDCLPQNFFDSLGIGDRIIDEVHQDFHFNFKLDLYTNVKHSTSLSATLINNNPFIEQMYKVAYPIDKRYLGSKINKYINSIAVMYTIEEGVKVRSTHHGSKNYSHNAYEDSIIRNKLLLSNYLNMIDDIVYDGYILRREPGDKLAVFASCKRMCTLIAEYLSEQYPELNVKRYIAEDPYENLIESDIRVTTIQSGGTAHDIPDLITVILTVSVDSIQSNVQTFGRLRQLKNKEMKFYYIVNSNEKKQMIYHTNRMKMLQNRAATFKEINYSKVLKGYKNKY